MKFFEIMRIRHWTKNLFVFAGLIFGKKLGGSVEDVTLAVGMAVGGFFCFCLAASAVYILNDIIDRRADKIHPEKSKRPIAAGSVGVGSALIVFGLCAVVSIVGFVIFMWWAFFRE